MGFFRPRFVKRNANNTYTIRFPDHVLEWLPELSKFLDDSLDGDTDDLRRLFPTAYPDDPELDAGYQILARGELIDHRRDAIRVLQETIDQEVLSEDEITAWMSVVNDVRLVLGTRLDVGEAGEELDEAHTNAPSMQLYELLGAVLYEIVEALSESLPD